MTHDATARAIEALDALHARDPRRVDDAGQDTPRELAYARRMTAALERLAAEPSPALQLAVRAQHLERWTLPRGDFPEGRAGYHRWRNEQKRRHAARAAETLRGAGVDEATVERVAALVQKRGLGRGDAEAQALEDCACLVFIEMDLAAFAQDRERSQLMAIVRKTWAKMSEDGRREALAIPLAAELATLVRDAVRGDAE